MNRPADDRRALRLAATLRAQAHQKAWFEQFRREVLEEGRPYVIADATTPHEIFHAMDVPVVSVPWYSSLIAAKQLSPYYMARMAELGYHDQLPRYTSLPFISTLDADPARAPYGGLPKPALILDRLRGDYAQRIGEQWAAAFGVPHVVLDAPSQTTLGERWYERGIDDWEALYETPRLDFQVEQLRALITTAEAATGRRFDAGRFAEEMARINRAGELVAEVHAMLARTRPCPVPLDEQSSITMAATWHRGSAWSVTHLAAYRDEVRERVAAGAGCPGERVRLLWLNNGLWFNTGFYRAFEASHGASFVWSMYSNLLDVGYRRTLHGDPLRALAARHISMNEQLHLPPWMADWVLHEARAFGAHGAVMLVPAGDRLSAFGTRFARLALERAGLPVLELHANMVDARLWDDAAMTARVATFIEQHAAPIARGEREGLR